MSEIESIIARGGLSSEQAVELWECLYLTQGEIGQVLELVKSRSSDQLATILHTIVAYTGMRRGEVLRLRWVDVNLDHSVLNANSRKQSRSRSEITRQIEIHPELARALESWSKRQTRGQFVIGSGAGIDPLTPAEANRLFRRPLRNSKWKIEGCSNRFKIGFHTYRHSFASNLAAAGVDQRVIDEFLGHTTEAMRRRYRHLFPSVKRDAIRTLQFSPVTDIQTRPDAIN